MTKTFVGPQLRQLRRERHQTQAQMAKLRGAIDHAPRLVEQFLHLYGVHRNTLERLMRHGTSISTDGLLATSAEAVVHDFFRDHSNYFHDLEVAAEALRATEANEPDDIFAMLKA